MNLPFCFAVAAIMSGFPAANAQPDRGGVYRRSADFSNQKLSVVSDCRTEKHQIKCNDFLGKTYTTVIHPATSYKLKESEIFGLRTCDGSIIRFWEKKALLLINPGESIMIYRRDIVKPRKEQTSAIRYYFSKDRSLTFFSVTILMERKLARLIRYS